MDVEQLATTTEEHYIDGEVLAIFFSNPSNYYKVLLVKVAETNTNYLEQEIVITGNFGAIHEGESYQFFGQLFTHPKYGLQFQAERYGKNKPSSVPALIAYFSGAEFPGVGKKSAERIVDFYGEDALDAIIEDPESLEQVPYLTKKQRQTIKDVVSTEQGMQQGIIFLNRLGIGSDLAYKIYHLYEEETLEKIKRNPYRLIMDIDGIGFNRADSIAESLDIAPDAPERIAAGIFYTLYQTIMQNGDTYIKVKPLLERSLDVLESGRAFIIEPDLLVEAFGLLVEGGEIVADEGRVYLPSLFAAEIGVATHLKRLAEAEVETFSEKETADVLKEIEKGQGFTYDSTQRAAITAALKEPLFILTGGPGTGKTTVIDGIIQAYAKLNDVSLDLADYDSERPFPILQAAPTGRASKRMQESTGFPASTIHRLLGLTAEEHEEDMITDRQLSGKLIVIDEMSMVDTWLLQQLVKAVPTGMKVILIGDKDQLPSVGPGQVLRDLLASEKIPHVLLKHVHRQESGSTIVELAHAIKENTLPADFLQQTADRNFFPAAAEQVVDRIEQVVSRALARGYTAESLQVLAPMYRGVAGINRLNQHLQELFNPPALHKKEVKHHETVYRQGDKVLQLQNDAEQNVFNGDIGYITAVVPAAESDLKVDELVIDFDGAEVIYPRNEWNKITLAYCCSIHKAQGSEYEIVILPLVNSYYRMLKKDLLYTGITRASHSLILIGEPSAFERSLHATSLLRQTTLAEEIQLAFEGKSSFKSEVKLSESADEENAETSKRAVTEEELSVESASSDTVTELTLPLSEKADTAEAGIIEEKNRWILTPAKVMSGQIDPLIGLEGLSPYDL